MTSYYWNRFGGERQPPGDELAALRRGVSGEPGCAPSMWRFMSADAAGYRLAAEHHALALFAIHQQSQPGLVHRRDVPMARQFRKLQTSGRFSEDAVNRRFFAAVTASELTEVVHHLRGLVRQLRSLPGPTGFDYTRLVEDLYGWHFTEGRNRVRRAWGLAYHRAAADDIQPEAPPEASPTEAPPTFVRQGEP